MLLGEDEGNVSPRYEATYPAAEWDTRDESHESGQRTDVTEAVATIGTGGVVYRRRGGWYPTPQNA